MRILIVEDDVLIAMNTAAMLHGRGCDVVGPARTSAGGLALVRAHLDGALLDIDLGGKTTIGIADALRASAVPYAFVSGYDYLPIPPAHARAPRVKKPLGAAELDDLLASFAHAAGPLPGARNPKR